MFDFYLASVVLFFLVLGILIYKDRKNIEVKNYILFMRKTKRFSNFIDRVAKISPRFWKAIATISIIVCIYYMGQGLYMLGQTSYQIFSGGIDQPGIQFVLPSPSAAGSSGPGYILIPFWFWIITIFCILVPHEFSHGVIARAEKIRLKSVGLLLLAFFPGAFVEPDEKQLKKAKLLPKLRVFAAGSGANILVSFMVLALLMYVAWPIATNPGIEILSVNASSPAQMAGLTAGMVLTGVNDAKITTSYQEYLAGKGYLFDEVKELQPNQTITFTTGDSSYDVKLSEVNDKPFMGIIYKPVFRVDAGFFLGGVVPLMTMIWLFSLAVAIFNILPLYPLDGGLMLEALTDRFAKKRSKIIVRSIAWLMLLVILYNFIGPSIF